jgi:hypothetical protein
MAKNQTRRLSPSVIADDIATINAVKDITGYAPANPAYAAAVLDADVAAVHAKQAQVDQLKAALAAAEDDLTAAQWKLHNDALGVKDQVRAQYGKNSNEVQAVGLKKPVEYKSPKRKAKPTEPQT